MKKTLLAVLIPTLIVLVIGSVFSVIVFRTNNPQGSYGNDTVTVTFRGRRVSMTVTLMELTTTSEGRFTMGGEAGDQILITYDDAADAADAPSGWYYDKENDVILCKFGILGEVTLEKKES